jgi:hypothetical protein
MKKSLFITLAIILFQLEIFAQSKPIVVPSPDSSVFESTLNFLASDWMEGRGSGEKGALLASDYVASMMQFIGLEPLGDEFWKKGSQQKSYFQNFEIIQYKIENANLQFFHENSRAKEFVYSQGSDFEVETFSNVTNAAGKLVFAGYGISSPKNGYDDYEGLDINGNTVFIIDKLPGHADTLSTAWKEISSKLPEDAGDLESKLKTAQAKGARALVVVGGAETSTQQFEPLFHCLPGDTSEMKIPSFRLYPKACKSLLDYLGIDMEKFEYTASQLTFPHANRITDLAASYSTPIREETLPVRNVLGIFYGKDTTKSVLIGAHYDHLGMHNGQIYNGSDDNASGASGLLALADVWKRSGIMPPCNIIFASWAAEEVGLLGSEYFVSQWDREKNSILLYINMDMISRSAAKDNSKRELSVGTRISDNYLKEIILENNAQVQPPFILDLWDVTGHSGSDYASFTAQNIPVMTFFSGYQPDYHTPEDDSSKADLKKMQDILFLVNQCLLDYLNSVNQ